MKRSLKGLIKFAGPSLRDKAYAGVPGASEAFIEQQNLKNIRSKNPRFLARTTPIRGKVGLDYARVEPDENVKHFFDVIVPYIKSISETAGTPGIDYDNSKFVPGFYNSIPIFYGNNRAYGKDDNVSGFSSMENGVFLNKNISGTTGMPSTMVHELKHQQNNDSFGNYYINFSTLNPFNRLFWTRTPWRVWKDMKSGRSSADNALLSSVYGFSPEDMKKYYRRNLSNHVLDEQGTTHSEHQFDIMREFRDKYGRNPTGPEYVKFIQGVDDQALDRWRAFKPNAYQFDADSRNGLDKTMSFNDAKSQVEQEADRLNFPKWIEINSDTPQEELEAYKNQEWYKASPELFDELLKPITGRGYRGFNPRSKYEYRRIDQLRVPKLNYDREAFRKALLNVARNTSRKYNDNQKIAGVKRKFQGLVKFAQQLGLDTFDPTPTSPTLFRQPTLYPPIDEDKHLEAVTMSSPRQFYGMTLGPITAAGAITAAPTLIPLARSTAGTALSRAKKIIPLVGHVAAGLGKEVGKTVWTGGQNLIEDESPIVSTLGHAYRAVTNVGPVAWWLKNKYNVTADVLKNWMAQARTLAQNSLKKNVN